MNLPQIPLYDFVHDLWFDSFDLKRAVKWGGNYVLKKSQVDPSQKMIYFEYEGFCMVTDYCASGYECIVSYMNKKIHSVIMPCNKQAMAEAVQWLGYALDWSIAKQKELRNEP